MPEMLDSIRSRRCLPSCRFSLCLTLSASLFWLSCASVRTLRFGGGGVAGVEVGVMGANLATLAAVTSGKRGSSW